MARVYVVLSAWSAVLITALTGCGGQSSHTVSIELRAHDIGALSNSSWPCTEFNGGHPLSQTQLVVRDESNKIIGTAQIPSTGAGWHRSPLLPGETDPLGKTGASSDACAYDFSIKLPETSEYQVHFDPVWGSVDQPVESLADLKAAHWQITIKV